MGMVERLQTPLRLIDNTIANQPKKQDFPMVPRSVERIPADYRAAAIQRS
jgi:hypothetical protein